MSIRSALALVAVLVFAVPTVAVAQTPDYTETPTTPPPTDYTETPTTPPPAPPTPPAEKPDNGVGGQQGGGNTAPAAPAPAATPASGTLPTALARTGSDAWRLGLLGLLAVAGGTVLLRTSRRA